jgi:glycosyltransferase involved in cell wall biosynthesis
MRSLAGGARSVGIQNAESDIVLLMDDDIAPSPQLVERHYRLHQRYPGPEFAVLGRVVTDPHQVDLLHPVARQVSAILTTEQGDLIVDPANLITSNVSFKRSLLCRVGLFTPGLPCLQDLDLSFRLKQEGLTLLHCPQAVGTHMRPINSIDNVIENGQKYGSTLGDWYHRLPHFRDELPNLGARLDTGIRGFRERPWSYAKDLIRRWGINRFTAPLLVRFARRMPITNPPGPLIIRCAKEIWAYYYRAEFYRRRGKNAAPLGRETSESDAPPR